MRQTISTQSFQFSQNRFRDSAPYLTLWTVKKNYLKERSPGIVQAAPAPSPVGVANDGRMREK